MVKLRDARYCNLKLFLIYLVIYGHLIEPGIWRSQALMLQYRWIYSFHMPLFSLLSGIFMTDSAFCVNQLKRTFPLYITLQMTAVLFGSGTVNISTPYWLLWYLLSYCIWSCCGWVWFRFFRGRGKFLILIGAVLIGCVAGYFPFIGRRYSLSRTLVFFPYFWTGSICGREFDWKRLRPVGLISLVASLAFMQFLEYEIPVEFLYQADPYGSLKNGFLLRLACYTLGISLCLFFLSFSPEKRFPFTKAGADTMPAYLLHAPIALCLRSPDIPWSHFPLVTALILYAIHKASCWCCNIYGITSPGRMDSRWRLFKKSTKNIQSLYTDSCCL